MGQSPLIIDISRIHKVDEELVGKKAHELGALWKLGVPLPRGFVITTNFFKEFLQLAEIDKKTYKSPILKHPSLSHSIDNLFQKQIVHNHIPQTLASELHHYYKHLSGLFKNKPLNIFSSSSDNKSIAFSGIKGDANLISKIKTIWSLTFKQPVAIVVQECFKSDIHGRISSNNPIIDRKLSHEQMNKLINYCKTIQKHTYFPKEIEYAVSKGKIFITGVHPFTPHPMTRSSERGLTPCSQSENLQCPDRKVVGAGFTGTADKIKKVLIQNSRTRKILTKGISINPGIVTGTVKILHNYHGKIKINKGEIVAVPNLDHLTFGEMENANAIIIDSVLPNSLGKALFRKKFHFPAIEGTSNATKILKNGNIITVNGMNGEIYSGGLVY